MSNVITYELKNERKVMDRKISTKEYVFLASMLFGMFFETRNIIFPIARDARLRLVDRHRAGSRR